MKALSTFILFMISTTVIGKTIVFIDNSVSNDTYIASNKERQISVAFKMGLEEVKKICSVQETQLIGKEPLSIFDQASKVKLIEDQKMIFGLIHSSEALLAAEAFKGSNILALSSGAATDLLNSKNPDFFSLANPVSKVSAHVSDYIKSKNIKNPIAIIPGNSSYSVELSKSLQKSLSSLGIQMQIELVDTNKNHQEYISSKMESKKYDFVYVPGFLQQTLPIFDSISKTGFKGIVYGSANLARSKSDLLLFSNSLNLKTLDIRFPATWLSGETKNSTLLESKFKKLTNEDIMGTAIYTYDAIVITGTFLCEAKNEITRQHFIEFIQKKVIQGKLGTIRKYHDLDKGHLTSNISTVKFNANTLKMEIE